MKGWRTIAIASVAIVSGVLLAIFGPAETRDMALTLIGSGIVAGGLRAVTNTPMGQKDEWKS